MKAKTNVIEPNRVRRQLLCASLGLPGLYLNQSWASVEPTVEQLIALSATLTDRPRSVFFNDIAARVLDVLRERGELARLSALIKAPASDDALSTEIISAWYTGTIQGKSGTLVVTYNNALMWDCAPYLHPSGNCGGPTNYWAHPST